MVVREDETEFGSVHLGKESVTQVSQHLKTFVGAEVSDGEFLLMPHNGPVGRELLCMERIASGSCKVFEAVDYFWWGV